jgi:hypothetical protein
MLHIYSLETAFTETSQASFYECGSGNLSPIDPLGLFETPIPAIERRKHLRETEIIK